jgi:hypothetical protein
VYPAHHGHLRLPLAQRLEAHLSRRSHPGRMKHALRFAADRFRPAGTNAGASDQSVQSNSSRHPRWAGGTTQATPRSGRTVRWAGGLGRPPFDPTVPGPATVIAIHYLCTIGRKEWP